MFHPPCMWLQKVKPSHIDAAKGAEEQHLRRSSRASPSAALWTKVLTSYTDSTNLGETFYIQTKLALSCHWRVLFSHVTHLSESLKQALLHSSEISSVRVLEQIRILEELKCDELDILISYLE